jgi:hypothetical protein
MRGRRSKVVRAKKRKKNWRVIESAWEQNRKHMKYNLGPRAPEKLSFVGFS